MPCYVLLQAVSEADEATPYRNGYLSTMHVKLFSTDINSKWGLIIMHKKLMNFLYQSQ